MVTEHTRLTIVTDTGPPPMPLFACRFHPHFPIRTFGFPRGLFPRRCNSVLVFSAHHLEDGRDGDLIGLAVLEECRGFHSPAAKMTLTGEPAAASEVALPALNAFKVHLFASLWPNSVSMRRTALRNEELVTSKRSAPAPLFRSSGRCFADKPCLPQMASTSLWRPNTPILATLCATVCCACTRASSVAVVRLLRFEQQHGQMIMQQITHQPR